LRGGFFPYILNDLAHKIPPQTQTNGHFFSVNPFLFIFQGQNCPRFSILSKLLIIKDKPIADKNLALMLMARNPSYSVQYQFDHYVFNLLILSEISK
jgi:hypothetical protein